MSDVSVEGTKSCNGEVRGFIGISGEEVDRESLGFATRDKVSPQRPSKRRKSKKISLIYFPGFENASCSFLTKITISRCCC